jgi:hypothetical protein
MTACTMFLRVCRANRSARRLRPDIPPEHTKISALCDPSGLPGDPWHLFELPGDCRETPSHPLAGCPMGFCVYRLDSGLVGRVAARRLRYGLPGLNRTYPYRICTRYALEFRRLSGEQEQR